MSQWDLERNVRHPLPWNVICGHSNAQNILATTFTRFSTSVTLNFTIMEAMMIFQLSDNVATPLTRLSYFILAIHIFLFAFVLYRKKPKGP